MRDIEKTSMEHETNSRRTRRRKRGRPVYAFFVVLLAGAVIVTLSMTVFFNIKTIRVTGNADSYTAEDIVNATGIQIGDNMMRLNTAEAEQKAINSLIYVESLVIDRQFPNTLEIQVQKCTPAYNVVYEYGTLIVSEHGRILEDTMDPISGLVTIRGYDPEETTPGKNVVAKVERCDKIFSEMRDLIYQGDLGVPIVDIDMTDQNDIMVNFDNRIYFDMGNWSEIPYKISFAEQVIAEQPADKEGYLVMIGTNQCSFRNKEDYEASRNAVNNPNVLDDLLSGETTEPTGEGETLPDGAENAGETPVEDAAE